jgi:hypothetical protein
MPRHACITKSAARATGRHAPAAVDQGADALAGQVLHHQEGRAVVGDTEVHRGGHVLALEGASGLRLALEARQAVSIRSQLGMQELHGEAPLDHLVLGLEHRPHTAGRQVANQAVLAAHQLANPPCQVALVHRCSPSCSRMASRSTA